MIARLAGALLATALCAQVALAQGALQARQRKSARSAPAETEDPRSAQEGRGHLQERARRCASRLRAARDVRAGEGPGHATSAWRRCAMRTRRRPKPARARSPTSTASMRHEMCAHANDWRSARRAASKPALSLRADSSSSEFIRFTNPAVLQRPRAAPARAARPPSRRSGLVRRAAATRSDVGLI